ncbi:zinc finger protein 28 homolog [Lutzomyia longipalpis]|uniref:zinc finger protein 28 homolog n=1 Tax=Lutzomyia longipalpis TaxID=7200 RepID=UPI0024839FE9|nr:zinc finger protein 28 homolog [Lutzomyia longipalpis]
MGSLENPLVHCCTIRDLLKRITAIHNEIIDHENTLPKCEVCWQNHAEFDSLKAQLFLIVQDTQDNSFTNENETYDMITKHVEEREDLDDDPLTTMIIKEEQQKLEDSPSCGSDVDNEWNTLEEYEEPCEKKLKRERIPCPTCDKSFCQGKWFTNHISRCRELVNNETTKPKDSDDDGKQTRFDCVYCEKMFFKKNEIKIHMQTHIKSLKSTEKDSINDRSTKKIGHTCIVCNKVFSSSNGLKKHEKFHEKRTVKQDLQETPYKCGTCRRFFRNSVMLERHNEYRNRANLICDTCNNQFCTHTDILNHQRTVHKINTSFKCRYCEGQFNNFRLLFRHHKMQHPAEVAPESPYLCDMCGIVMMDPRDLSYHVKTVHESKEFKCDICRKTFGEQTNFEEHQRIHIPISQLQDPYECDTCSKKFRTKRSLEKHRRLHTGEVTEMFCPVCRRRFINEKSLEDHLSKHANEKPRSFKCEVCEKSFTKLKYMNQHRKIDHNIFTNLMLNPKSKKNY